MPIAQYLSVTYGTYAGLALALDLFRPADSVARPGVIVIHGGGWSRGKREDVWPAAKKFAKAGMVAVCPSYPLAGFPSDDSDDANDYYQIGAIAPACADAVGLALDWMVADGWYSFDATRIGAFGPSAGGHLALWLGLAYQDTVNAIVAWKAPSDFVEQHGPQDPDGRAAVEKLFGGPPVDPLAADMSPGRYVSYGEPPIRLRHGDQDVTVPYGQSVWLQSMCDAVGTPCELITVSGAGHGWPADYERAALIEDVAWMKARLGA